MTRQSSSGTRPVPAGYNRRDRLERRSFSLRTLACSILRPRRQQVRRGIDNGNQHVDFYHRDILWLCAGILVMSAIDAFYTLLYSGWGAFGLVGPVETLIGSGVVLFVIVKVLLTGLSLILLVAVSSLNVFRIVRVETVLQGMLFVYMVFVLPQPWLQ